MIIHRHADGSEGYQYEIGDRVIVERTINGGWFDYGPTHAEACTITAIVPRSSWRTAELRVFYSREWGTARCFPWMVKPHAETIQTARTITADP